MKYEDLLKVILPDVLIDNFDVVNFTRDKVRLDIYLDEKKVFMSEDRGNVIAYGFGDYHSLRDFPIRGRATYLHVRKRKWLDKDTGEIFSYDWDISEHDGTRLNSEFVSSFKEEIESTPVSISTLARRNGLDGQTLRKQYKEVFIDFRTWGQIAHAERHMLFPENLGPDLSFDETCLSNGVVYTIFTNKAAHGRKGAIVEMVRGVSSDAVVEVLRGIPRGLRKKVKTVTTDLSSSMMRTARKAFPEEQLINDRFYVQKLASEAVDSLRVHHRRAVLEDENKAIAEYDRKARQAKTPQQKQAVGKWQPKFMENGETMSQIMLRSRHILFTHPGKWNEQQAQRAAILFKCFPDLEQAYGLCMELTRIFNSKTIPDVARLNLARWYEKMERFGSDVFNKVLKTFKNHNATIVNYFAERLTNVSAESFNAKIKTFRSQLRGVADMKFFMYRLATQYA